MTYYELWGEYCTICLQNDTDYYFINQCLCNNLVCKHCVLKLVKCPFCRKAFTIELLKEFKQDILTSIMNNLHKLYVPHVQSHNYWTFINDSEHQLQQCLNFRPYTY